MAIIKPSLKFEGSDLNLNTSSTPYIKEGVRRAIFNKSTNNEGAYLYFLPAYKADSAGCGVWYKKICIRDNFGTKFKEKYFVASRSEDPAEYFANNFRLLYPEESKPGEQEVNGKKFKKYPDHGRITDRVLYNVAFAQNLSGGAHVLDLPLRNGADALMNWLETKDISGKSRAPINDPDRCVPVHVRLLENSSNPWKIQVESTQPVQLPSQLADSDFLYNLDEVLVIKSKEEIIAKLREIYQSSIFDACMDGYPGLTRGVVQGASIPRPTLPVAPTIVEQAAPAVQVAPVIDIPRANIPSAPVKAVDAPPVADISSLPANPMATRLSKADALKMISEN